jgi:hypothetical protein|tara:strand:+ start:911 stop:1045 length:135 start_codon:yes stop_codon:yes gene_type:complete
MPFVVFGRLIRLTVDEKKTSAWSSSALISKDLKILEDFPGVKGA